jgi:hypothetical protein
MDIAEINPHQLAPTMGILGVGIMSLTDLSPLPGSNSTIGGGHICFGTIDFLPHPPTLLPTFNNFDREIHLTVGGFSFRVVSQGSFRLSDSIYSGLLAEKYASAATSASSIGSSSKVNSPLGGKPRGSC